MPVQIQLQGEGEFFFSCGGEVEEGYIDGEVSITLASYPDEVSIVGDLGFRMQKYDAPSNFCGGSGE